MLLNTICFSQIANYGNNEFGRTIMKPVSLLSGLNKETFIFNSKNGIIKTD